MTQGVLPFKYEEEKSESGMTALACLPKNVETVRLRSDTAGYQHELLKYCEMGTNKCFGRIEFAIGCGVGKSFKEAAAQVPETDWHPLYRTVGTKQIETGTQWAEVCFVPNKIGHSKNGPEYRYLAKRQVLTEQLILPGMEDPQLSLPFPTMEMNNSRYKIYGVQVAVSFPIGMLADRLGHIPILVAGYILGVLTAALTACAFWFHVESVALLAVIFFIAGLYVAVQEALESGL